MAIDQCKDIENGPVVDLEKPFLQPHKAVDFEDESENGNGNNIAMVLLCTAVAVCGSFEFGSCVSSFIHLVSFFCLKLCSLELVTNGGDFFFFVFLVDPPSLIRACFKKTQRFLNPPSSPQKKKKRKKERIFSLAS